MTSHSLVDGVTASIWHIMGSIPVKNSDFFFVSQLCHNQINTHFITLKFTSYSFVTTHNV